MGRHPAASGDFSVDEYRALAEFRFQIRRFLRFSEEQARSNGVEPQQHQLLLAIKGLPDGINPTIGELSSRMQLRHHTIVELVDRLAGRGLVERRPSDTDHREVLLALTRSGQAVLRHLTVAHREELDSAGGELLKALRTVLRDVHKRQINAA